MASASDSTRRHDVSKMREMTRKRLHSPSGIPSRGKGRTQLPGLWELDPADPRVGAYELETTEWWMPWGHSHGH
jgi:hypothetical protein